MDCTVEESQILTERVLESAIVTFAKFEIGAIDPYTSHLMESNSEAETFAEIPTIDFLKLSTHWLNLSCILFLSKVYIYQLQIKL